MITDLDLAKSVMIKDFDKFSDREKIFEDNEHLKHNLGNMNLEDWKEARRAMTPAFSSGKLRKVSACT